MGVYTKKVQVPGEANEIYRILVGVLTNNRYTIDNQNPPMQVTASRGSKAVTFIVGTADYEELNVTLFATSPGQFDVQFNFNFPSVANLFIHRISEKGKSANCDILINEFARLVSSPGIQTAGAPQGAGDKPCPKCRQMNTQNAVFCANCGENLAYPSQAVSKPRICGACSTEISATARFCPACGAATNSPTPPSIVTCPACSTRIPAGRKFCPECGAKRG
jgi:RNA polymerase subunit RPABC4/transcription elongation factor Spt4